MTMLKAAFLLHCLAFAVEVDKTTLNDGDDTGDTTEPSTGAADGLWTNHDWSNDTIGIGVSNGVPYGLTDAIN